jgi:hypothetical protein
MVEINLTSCPVFREGLNPASDPEKLYSEIGRLKMQLDWLKKKVGPYL